ncbi:hypothetical protein PISMIDRAFT_542955 [Pisolithus microcarpus 441]|uniref:Uncharacterized protein n=1 Tax=Pisolithus microcarpus 441 TaxID=765257 RepID=A0A0C9Z5C7_9AGAM|nr:hypothetical protein PISMIDRAFT_542955 [Pisolithus microcarpus 441]
MISDDVDAVTAVFVPHLYRIKSHDRGPSSLLRINRPNIRQEIPSSAERVLTLCRHRKSSNLALLSQALSPQRSPVLSYYQATATKPRVRRVYCLRGRVLRLEATIKIKLPFWPTSCSSAANVEQV